MSYEFKGTEGPWHHCQITSPSGQMNFAVESLDGTEVCVINGCDQQAEDDARAIAEVPELIEEGANLLAVLTGEGGTKPEAIYRFRQALAKATGGEV